MCISSVGLKEKAKRGKERECREDYRTKQRGKKKTTQEGGKRIPTSHFSSEYNYSKTYIFSWDICKWQRVSGEEWMYKTPLSTVFVSPLSGSSQMEMCLVCHGSSPPGDQIKPICIRHAARTLQHWPVNGSGRSLRAVAVTRLLGVWSSLAMGWSLRILPAQNLWSQRRRCAYFSRPV